MILAEIFRLAVLFLVTLTAAVNGSANALVEAVDDETERGNLLPFVLTATPAYASIESVLIIYVNHLCHSSKIIICQIDFFGLFSGNFLIFFR